MPRGKFLPLYTRPARTRRRQAVKAKPGRPRKEEQTLLENLALTANPDLLSQPEALERVAQIVHRSPEVVKQHLIEARDNLRDCAPQMVEHIKRAAEVAAAQGDHKPAAWVLERVEQDGERVVPLANQNAGQSGVTVMIGVALGGMSKDSPT